MEHPVLPRVLFTSTLVLLGGLLAGCAGGTNNPPAGAGGSSSGENQGDPGDTEGSGAGDPGGSGSGGEWDPGGGGETGSRGGPGQGGSPGTGTGTGQGGSPGTGAGQGGSPDTGSGGAPGTGSGSGSPGDNDGMGVFLAPNAWTKNIGGLPKNAESDAIIDWLDKAGGWGSGVMRIDFGIEVLEATNATPKKQFYPTGDFFYPDCDEVPFPVPPGGAIEGEDGYECTNDGDCHLIVVHKDENKLYEMWRANIVGNNFDGGCAAVWDLTKTYPDNLRGEGCTSADAGGFPIAAMLFTPEEVAAGEIKHAIRFILPNSRIRDNVYVHPGTHSTNATSGGPNAPPYGVRLRLRADFPMESLPSDGARVIAKAIQEYGMFLSDGGTIALTGESDRFSAVKWSDLDVDSYSLDAIQVTDMEVVDMGDPINWSGDCIRN